MSETIVKSDLPLNAPTRAMRWRIALSSVLAVAALAAGSVIAWDLVGNADIDTGLAAARRGDDVRAIEHYSAALASSRLTAARRAEVLNYRAVAELDTRHDQEAIADSDAAIVLKPDLAPAYSNRARAYATIGEIDMAILDNDVLISLRPDDGAAYLARAELLVAKALDERALPDEDQAVKLLPKGASIYAMRAATQLRLGHLEQALADYDAAIGLNDKDPRLYQGRGFVQSQQERYRPAIDEFSTSIRLAPHVAAAFKERGAARFALGQFAEAIDDLAYGLTLQPQDAYAVLWLHIAMQRAGRDDALPFAANAAHAERSGWAGSMVALFEEKVTPEQVRDMSRLGNGPLKCHAAFYTGEYESLHGQQASAIAALAQAARICGSLPERFLAKAELDRLRR